MVKDFHFVTRRRSSAPRYITPVDPSPGPWMSSMFCAAQHSIPGPGHPLRTSRWEPPTRFLQRRCPARQRERIGQGHPDAQRHNRENHRHAGFSQAAIQPVQQKQRADEAIKGAFYAEIPDAFPNDRPSDPWTNSPISGPRQRADQQGRESRRMRRKSRTPSERPFCMRPVCFAP